MLFYHIYSIKYRPFFQMPIRHLSMHLSLCFCCVYVNFRRMSIIYQSAAIPFTNTALPFTLSAPHTRFPIQMQKAGEITGSTPNFRRPSPRPDIFNSANPRFFLIPFWNHSIHFCSPNARRFLHSYSLLTNRFSAFVNSCPCWQTSTSFHRPSVNGHLR